MKISIDFENGMVVSLKPENVQLVDNGGKETVLTFNTDHTLVPIMFFKSILASPAELKARAALAETAAEQQPELPKADGAADVALTDEAVVPAALRMVYDAAHAVDIAPSSKPE